ncbi:MAG: hypothetical protein CMH57_11790 [Myxococcales bacterium]|nr:hypothetical protein [Myxococcales bacterium]
MDKGTRVEIIKGYKGVGVIGTVFWSGPDKYNDGETRLGVKGNDGETYWVSANDVQATDEEAAEVAPPRQNVDAGDGPPLAKGSRVEWGDGMAGSVFWYGASKFGDGMRVGVEADDGSKHWLDAFEVTAVAAAAAPSSPADVVPPPSDNDPVSSSSAPPWAYDDSDPGPMDGGYIPMSDEPVYIDDSDMPPPDDLF